MVTQIETFLDFLRDLYNNDKKPLDEKKYSFIENANIKISEMPDGTTYQKQEAFALLFVFSIFE